MPPDLPADVREQAALFFRALAAGHDAYAALSTLGHNQLVPDSGHFIQNDQPAAVVDAVFVWGFVGDFAFFGVFRGGNLW